MHPNDQNLWTDWAPTVFAFLAPIATAVLTVLKYKLDAVRGDQTKQAEVKIRSGQYLTAIYACCVLGLGAVAIGLFAAQSLRDTEA